MGYRDGEDHCILVLGNDQEDGILIQSEGSGYLFKSQTHEKMSVSAIEEVYKKYIAKAKQEHPDKFRSDDYTPHTFLIRV